MPPYDGPERRKQYADFEDQVLQFMARIDEKMENQSARCANHATRIEDGAVRLSSLEATREYAKGALRTVAVGAPAIGSLAWFVFEIGKFLKGAK